MGRTEREQRTERRRQQVITAARTRFRAKGFHGANMAEIAREAGMSVGHIYHYFPSKDVLVGAIVEDIYHRRLDQIMRIEDRAHPTEHVLQRVMTPPTPEEADDDALLIGAAAEATHNPTVAELMRQGAQRMHAQLREIYCSDHPGVDPVEASVRVELMAALGEGWAYRRPIAPPVDAAALARLYRDVLAVVLAE